MAHFKLLISKFFEVVFVVFLTALAIPAHAFIHEVPPDLAHEALSEAVPTAFAPSAATVEDYSLEWSGPAIPGVKFSLEKGTLEWVRVGDLLVLPRARVWIEADSIDGGRVEISGFSYALTVSGSQASQKFPVALISGPENVISLQIKRDSKVFNGHFTVRFSPRSPGLTGVFFDSSCSPYSLRQESVADQPLKNSWAYVGCRMVRTQLSSYTASTLEVLVLWDGVGQQVQMGGVTVAAKPSTLWQVRAQAGSSPIELKARDQVLRIGHSVPEKQAQAFLGAGIGPYTYTFLDSADNVTEGAPVATLYGSYFLTENARIVMFNATTVHRRWNTDLGLYVNYESSKLLDNRISVNFLLGAHVIGFKAFNTTFFRFGAPQGFEFIFRDAGFKKSNVGLGGFLYPPISGKSYYNLWLRWGGPRFFGEINYIGLAERIDDAHRIYSRSLGLSFGMPLFRFY